MTLKKHRIVKEDGRYLIYFTFEEETQASERSNFSAGSEAGSVHALDEPENGEQQ